MIKAIIFDCFGVLYGGSVETLVSLCPSEKVDILRDLSKQADYGFISGPEYIDHAAELLGKTPAEVHAIVDSQHVRNTALIEYSQNFRPHYAIGLLSNVSRGTIDPLFPREERDRLFDQVVLSYEVAMMKPDPEIFRLIAEKLGREPSECVMIDDLAVNCAGAESVGMKSVQHITNEDTMLKLQRILQENT